MGAGSRWSWGAVSGSGSETLPDWQSKLMIQLKFNLKKNLRNNLL